MNTRELQISIKDLDKKCGDKEKILLNNLRGLKKYFDPVFHIQNALPIQLPIACKINILLDNTISDATHAINNKIVNYSNDSFLLKSGKSLVTRMVTKTVYTNRRSIKAISLSVIKNIFN